MYKYSPIDKIRVANFRCLSDVEIDFNRSPIVALKGDNESGKTSFIKAFAVAAMHAWPTEQKSFIRDFTNGFAIAIRLDDGTVVSRLKLAAVNRYSVTRDGQTLWAADKLESGTPTVVQEVMGLIEEPETKEFLQIRTYEDQLLFVVTPTSANYKMMYWALKVDNLTRAIKCGSEEVNSLKYDMNSNNSSIVTLGNYLRGIQIVDIEPAINIRNRVQQQLQVLDKLEAAMACLERLYRQESYLAKYAEIEQAGLEEVNETKFLSLINAARAYNNLGACHNKIYALEDVNNLEPVDERTMADLYSAMGRMTQLDTLSRKAQVLAPVGSLETVDLNTIAMLDRAVTCGEKEVGFAGRLQALAMAPDELVDIDALTTFSRAMSLVEKVDTASKEAELIANINRIESIIKSMGVATATCSRCGETVVVEVV